MTSLNKKLEFYFTLINPLIPRKRRACLCYGKDVEKYYDFLDESQWWPTEDLKAYQTEKFKKLISYVYDNVPYYHELMRESKLVPNDINSSVITRI